LTELKVGLLTLAAIISIVVMSLKVTQNQSGFGDYVAYRTIIPDAAGIFAKTPIKVAGINSGRIKNIELAGNSALITFEILDKVKITKGSILRIKSVGFLGDKYLDIFINRETDQVMEENTFLPAQSGGGMEDITKDISDVMIDVKAIARSFKEALEPSDGSKPLTNILKNVDGTTKDLKFTMATIRRMLEENDKKIADIVENFKNLSQNMVYETDGDQQGSLMGMLRKTGPILDDAKDAMGELKTIIADVRKGKGTVGRLLRDDEVVDQVSEALSGVNKMVNKVNTIRTELDIASSYSSASSSVTGLKLDIYPSPERFYRLGVVTSELGIDKKTQTETEVNGTTTVEEKIVRDRDTYRFDLQVGRRIHNFAFRIGLIESTGGIGFDYYMDRIKTRWSAELFDYREDLGPNLRLMGDVQLWNVFYAHLAFEDLVSKESDNRAFVIGAGLRFNDDDLKSLVGYFLL